MGRFFSNCNGDPVLLKEMILSSVYHIHNKHSRFPKFKKFTKCAHKKKHTSSKIDFLEKHNPCLAKLEAILRGPNDSRFKDLKKLCHNTHTGDLESWNARLAKYAPKLHFFDWHSMNA